MKNILMTLAALSGVMGVAYAAQVSVAANPPTKTKSCCCKDCKCSPCTCSTNCGSCCGGGCCGGK